MNRRLHSTLLYTHTSGDIRSFQEGEIRDKKEQGRGKRSISRRKKENEEYLKRLDTKETRTECM